MVAGAASIWGVWSLILRPTHLPATVSSPIVFLVMGLVSLPFALRGPRMPRDFTTIGLIVANAAFDGLNVLAFFAALEHTTVAIAVLTHYLTPILIALAAPTIDRVKVPGARGAALVALVGLVIILEPWHAPAGGALVGALLGTLSAVFYTANTFTLRRIAARIGPTRALSYHSLLVGLALSPLVFGHLDLLTLPSLALLSTGAIIIGAAAGVVFTLGLLRIGSARAAILTFFEPIVAVALGSVVWGEPLHVSALLGGLLVLGAGIEVARKAR
jgi:drug/metabolite transporter (DMT)-like permease